jgi:hypothetical protein
VGRDICPIHACRKLSEAPKTADEKSRDPPRSPLPMTSSRSGS